MQMCPVCKEIIDGTCWKCPLCGFVLIGGEDETEGETEGEKAAGEGWHEPPV
jgi:rubredoxin